jgi:hypothetical protein
VRRGSAGAADVGGGTGGADIDIAADDAELGAVRAAGFAEAGAGVLDHQHVVAEGIGIGGAFVVLAGDGEVEPDRSPVAGEFGRVLLAADEAAGRSLVGHQLDQSGLVS